jgi:hypothetical protein
MAYRVFVVGYEQRACPPLFGGVSLVWRGGGSWSDFKYLPLIYARKSLVGYYMVLVNI